MCSAIFPLEKPKVSTGSTCLQQFVRIAIFYYSPCFMRVLTWYNSLQTSAEVGARKNANVSEMF